MHALDLKIPPVAVVLLIAALMWLGSYAVPTLAFAVPGRIPIAVAAAAAGVLISASGVISFRKARTTVNPQKPESSTSLVVSGIYAFTRNPMYLGFLLVLAGWAVFLSNAISLLLLPAFVFYIRHFQIEPEERALTSLFGKEFIAYRSRVRRWL